MVDFAVELAELATQAGAFVVIENPGNSRIWKYPKLSEIIRPLAVVESTGRPNVMGLPLPLATTLFPFLNCPEKTVKSGCCEGGQFCEEQGHAVRLL